MNWPEPMECERADVICRKWSRDWVATDIGPVEVIAAGAGDGKTVEYPGIYVCRAEWQAMETVIGAANKLRLGYTATADALRESLMALDTGRADRDGARG